HFLDLLAGFASLCGHAAGDAFHLVRDAVKLIGRLIGHLLELIGGLFLEVGGRVGAFAAGVRCALWHDRLLVKASFPWRDNAAARIWFSPAGRASPRRMRWPAPPSTPLAAAPPGMRRSAPTATCRRRSPGRRRRG